MRVRATGFWAYLLTVKRDTEKNCNQISLQMSGERLAAVKHKRASQVPVW